MKLTEKQRCILATVNRFHLYDTTEISERFGKPPYWARPALSRLANCGMVERFGTSVRGGQCWGITEAGRKALEEAK